MLPVLYMDLGGCSCWSCCAYVSVFLGLRGTALTAGAGLCVGLAPPPPKPEMMKRVQVTILSD